MKKPGKEIELQAATGKDSIRQAIAVAAAVASLGASLGVQVGELWAAEPKTATGIDGVKSPAVQSDQIKMESNQHKLGRPESEQIKMESQQHKFFRPESQQLKHSTESMFLKYNGKLLKNGDRLMMVNGKPQILSKSGKQVAAQDGAYELQDGGKFVIKGGAIAR